MSDFVKDFFGNPKAHPYYKNIESFVEKYPEILNRDLFYVIDHVMIKEGFFLDFRRKFPDPTWIIYINDTEHHTRTEKIEEAMETGVKTCMDILGGHTSLTAYDFSRVQFLNEGEINLFKRSLLMEDNVGTNNPFVLVQEAKYIPINSDYETVDKTVYVTTGDDPCEYDTKEEVIDAIRSEMETFHRPKEGEDYYVVETHRVWEVVQCFFLLSSAKRYIKERPNRELRNFTISLHDKHELLKVRNFLINGGKIIDEEEAKKNHKKIMESK